MTIQSLLPAQVVKAHQHGVWSLCTVLDDFILSGGGDGQLKVWKLLQTGKVVLLATISTPHSEVLALWKTRFGKIISVGHHGGIVVWEFDAENAHLGMAQNLGVETEYWEYNDRIAETSAGDLVTWGPTPPAIWEWMGREETFRFKQELPIHQKITVLRELADDCLVSGDLEGKITFWQMDQVTKVWHPVKTLQAHHGAIHALAWTRENNLVSAGGDRLIKIWQSVPNGLVLKQELQGHKSPIHKIIESQPDEVISGDYGTRVFVFRWRYKPEFWVWRKKGESIQPVQHQTGWVLGYLEPNLLLTDGMAENASLWQKRGELYDLHATLQGHQAILSVHQLLENGRLITADLEGYMAIWDIRGL